MKNIKKTIICFLICIISSFTTLGKDNITASKDTVEIGIWVEDIFNINYSDQTYEVVFYIWANSNKENFDLEKYTDFNNSTDASFALKYNTKLKDGRFHSEAKAKVKFLNPYNVKGFPFDNQKIKFNIEFIKDPFVDCYIFLDTINSSYCPENIEDFQRKQFSEKHKIKREDYKTNWGNTDLGKKCSWYRLEIEIDLKRDSWNIAYKLFITLFISFLLASSSILLPLKMSEEKFALIVGSLFTSIGNKYITDSILPVSGSFNLSDSIHMLTFVFITIMSLYAVVEQRYKIDRSRRVDLWLFLSMQIIYLSLIYLIIP